MTDTTYNGWKNRNTWNVALWLGNDEKMYLAMLLWLTENPRTGTSSPGGYATFAREVLVERWPDGTPDGTKWLAHDLDFKALNDTLESHREDYTV